MRPPQRSLQPVTPRRPGARSRAAATIAFAIMTVLAAASLILSSGHAPAAASTFAVWLSSGEVGQTAAVTVSGTKSADATVTVELRPPGNAWTSVTGSCSGTASGSTSWSCTLVPAGERHLGAHKVRVTHTLEGAASSTETQFVVKPPPALAAPAPDPTTTSTPTPTPTVTTPAPTPTPTRTPGKPLPTPEAPEQTETPQAPELSDAGVVPPSAGTAARPLVAAAPPAPTEISLPTESLPDDGELVRAFAPPTGIDRNDPAAPSALSEGLPDVWRDPLRLLMAVGFGALFLLLVGIPAEVLNSTLEANSHRWRWMYAWALPLVARMSAVAQRLPAWGSSPAAVIIMTSVAFGFADPNFGFDLTSLRLVASLAIGLLLVVHLPSLITARILGQRWHVPTAIITQPGAIIIAVLGVIASRMLEFSPGLLVGLVLGIELAASARADDRRRAIVVRMIVTLGVAFTAWLAYAVITAALAGTEPTFMSIFVTETLVAAVHEGITGLLVALLPLMFLDGKTLFDSSKATWVALAAPTAIAFALLVLPTSDRLDADAPIVMWIAVFVGFSLTVAAIWFGFRVLEKRDERAAAEADTRESVDA